MSFFDILLSEATVPAPCPLHRTNILPAHRVWEETKLCKRAPSPAGWGIIWNEKVEGASSFPRFTLWQYGKNLVRKQCCSVCGVPVCICVCHWGGLGWYDKENLLIAPLPWRVIRGGGGGDQYIFSMRRMAHPQMIKSVRESTEASCIFPVSNSYYMLMPQTCCFIGSKF